jgi:hypothetical protein
MPHEIDFLKSYDLDSIAAELRRVAAMLGKQSVTGREMNRLGRVSVPTILQRFGSMRNAHIAAGLVPTRARRWSTAELIKVLIDVWTLTQKDRGRRPRMDDFRKYRIPVSPWAITDRFGSWKNALIAASQMSNSGVPPEVEPSPRTRQRLSPRTRFRVFQRDIYQCCICHISGVRLEVDHILPVSKGGSDAFDNLQTLCVPCNRGKRNSIQ